MCYLFLDFLKIQYTITDDNTEINKAIVNPKMLPSPINANEILKPMIGVIISIRIPKLIIKSFIIRIKFVTNIFNCFGENKKIL